MVIIALSSVESSCGMVLNSKIMFSLEPMSPSPMICIHVHTIPIGYFKKPLFAKGLALEPVQHFYLILTIGENAMIGAGSMVTKNIPAGEVWVGNPAHFVKKVGDV
ncbi:hypothetical protein NXV07_10255 [Bacteroides fragilis]|nr:hypothetical protein [Bacteroides fragilis]